jgi:hypothetical protein
MLADGYPMNVILFVLSNFFVLAWAAMISDILFAKQSRWFRLLALLCFAAIEIVWIELAAGLAGKLTFPIVSFITLAVFILTGCVWLTVRRRQYSQRIIFGQFLLVPVIFIAALGLGRVAGQYGFQGTHFCVDDLSYHATAVVHWYQAKDISAGALNYHAYKPLNAELFSLWFFLPFGQDGLVFLSGLFWMILTCAAGAVLMQNLGIERKWFGPVIFSFFCCNVALYQATLTFTTVDLAGPAMVLAAMAFLSWASDFSGTRQWPGILLSGLCTGFAFGTKTPFVTVFLVLLIWVFWAFKNRFGVRVGNVFLFGFCAMLGGGFWYIRDMILTGNPIFPGQAGPFDGPLTREIQFSTSIAGHIIKSGFDISVILEILRLHLDWPIGVLVLSAAGYIAGLVLLFRDNQCRRTIGLLLLTAAVMLATYPGMPFSAQNDAPQGQLTIALRFVIGPFLVGLILFSVWLNTHSKCRWLIYGIYLLGVGVAFWAIPNAIKTLAGAAAFVWWIGFCFYRKTLPSILFSPSLVFSMILGGLLGLAMMFPVQQAKTDQRLFTDRLSGLNLGDCWQKMETLPAGSKVTGFGALGYCYYPWFGRHYQLCPQPLMTGLKPYQPLHLRWIEDPVHTVWWPKPVEANSTMWIQGLIQNQTDYLVIQRYPGKPWPEVYEILHNSTIAERIDEGDNWAIWKIKK